MARLSHDSFPLLIRLTTLGMIAVSLAHPIEAQLIMPCPAPANGAFTGCYFSNTELSGNPVFVRTDSVIDFYWGNGSPDSSIPPLNYSIRWSGNFMFTAGNYKFNATTSDGMRLYVDGNLIVNRWRDQSANGYIASQTLSEGNHLIVVEYYERQGGATAQVSWQNTGSPSQAPVISSFTASPAAAAPGSPVSLSWSVQGATSLNLDHGAGDVTDRSSVAIFPSQTTTYNLTATNSSGSTIRQVTVVVASPASVADTQAPLVPVLISATAAGGSQADLAWTASSDNVGVAGYQIIRNGSVAGSVDATKLNWSDTTVTAGSTFIYTIRAFDAAGNYSQPSNAIQVTVPVTAISAGACPAPAVNSFTGCYYSNTTLTGNPTLIRTDSRIDFYWGNGSPDRSLPPLNFSVRWSGNFTFPAGVYNFSAMASDGVRLYIDGNLIIDKWRDQSAYIYSATQTVSQGSHLIVMEYYERLGGATAQLTWQNTSPVTQPVISSFSATPSSTAPGVPVTLVWAVSGATSTSIDQGVGDVTGRSSVVVFPARTTSYTLAASGAGGTSTALVTVNVTSAADTQAPTPPTLVSAIASGPARVDLVWTQSSDNVGVTSYQILRNGAAVTSVPASGLSYSDTTVTPGTIYFYSLRAGDQAGNYSAPSNTLQVTTPAATTSATVEWHGACWASATIYGITGHFQGIDFRLTTTTAVPLQGTLFFGPSCDISYGTDNMNDYNALTGSTHMVQGFSHHPDEIPTSAIYWIGDRTADGMCAKGSPCSGCVHYDASTPSCDVIP